MTPVAGLCPKRRVQYTRDMQGRKEPFVRDQPIDARRAALIVIDVQNQVFQEQARVGNACFQHSLHERVLPNLQRLIRTLPVI